jgi:hypothetical protein
LFASPTRFLAGIPWISAGASANFLDWEALLAGAIEKSLRRLAFLGGIRWMRWWTDKEIKRLRDIGIKRLRDTRTKR